MGRSFGVDKTVYSERGRRLARLLCELRQEAGLSQTELAQRLDVPRQIVSRIELGERRGDLVELDTICGALGVSTISAVWRFLSDDT